MFCNPRGSFAYFSSCLCQSKSKAEPGVLQDKISVNSIKLCFSFYSGYLLRAVNPQMCLQGCSHAVGLCQVPLIPCSHGPMAAQCHLHLHCECPFALCGFISISILSCVPDPEVKGTTERMKRHCYYPSM